ncbi:MAG: serine/threonine-protein phosphatase [Actinomycetia bacterium]|nr:serine/threonine-protein phosphatase [Actinomycetes bacterium]
MQLRGAIASHVGNVRDTNQDRAHFGGYVAAVADGMGGHQGGEMAASIAIKEFLEVVDPIVPGGLVEIVEGANRAVFEQAADPDLRGMGTTLVALTLRPEEEVICVVNVGDSRAYFSRGDVFEQVSLDHSLVEDLVRQNRLTPEEALTHPQRNILTRALGIASHVEVDRFLHAVEIGDRFLLCSDGLFNEVTEDEISRILTEFEEPNDAADTLVNAALTGAARDNVTVAVVDIVADGEGGNVSSLAPETLQVPVVPTSADDTVEVEHPPNEADHDFSGDLDFGEGAASKAVGEPIVRSAGMTQAGETAGAVGVDVAEVDTAIADEQAHNGPVGSAATIELPPVESSQRGSQFRRILIGLIMLAVAAGAGYYAVNSYATNKWFVGTTESGQLAIFNGRPNGFLGVDPTVDELLDIAFDDLLKESQVKVEKEELFDSLDKARVFVESLDLRPPGVDALEQIEPTDETDTSTQPDQPSSTGSTDAETTETSAAQPPPPTTAAQSTTTTTD